MTVFFYFTFWWHFSEGSSLRSLLYHQNNDISQTTTTSFRTDDKHLGSTLSQVVKLVDPIIKKMTAGVPQESQQGEFSLRRHLDIGDFAALNELFNGAVLKLPNTSVDAGVKLDLSNIRCTGVSIGDVIITYSQTNQKLIFTLDIIELDLTCYLNYRYSWTIFNGGGECDAYTDNNSAKLSLRFESPDFDLRPPTTVNIESCETNIRITNLNFRGGVVAAIINLVESLIRDTIANEVEKFVCTELRSLGDNLGADMLNLADNFINPYFEDLSPEYANPLYLEDSMVVPDTVDLLNFLDIENELGSSVSLALNALNGLFGAKKIADGSEELGINGFLRDNILDDTGALIVDIADLDFATDGVIIEGHDTLTESKITIDSVKVYGLDTFTTFEPLFAIGNYTLSNNLTLSFINVEVSFTTDIKPSTLPDSLIETPSAARVIEQFTVDFGIDDIDATLSFLLAIDQLKLGNVKLSSMLSFDNLIGCLLSGIFEVSTVGFDVSVRNVREPKLAGFVSPGIDRIASTAVAALFAMYETVFLKAVPNVFQTTIRDILNNDLIGSFLNNPDFVSCNSISFESEFVDFRDLLLGPEEAAAIGGRGVREFGDLGSSVMGFIREQLFELDDSGYPAINSVLVGALPYSEIPGSILMNNTLFEWENSDIDELYDYFVDRFKFAIYNLRFLDLDTITDPFRLIYPTDNPYVLSNRLNFGPVPDRGITAKLRFLVELEGEGSPMAMDNEFDIIMKIPTSSLTADIIAKVSTLSMTKFPLNDILNYNCWLAMLPDVILDEKTGRQIAAETDLVFGISNFIFDILDFSLDAECVVCTSPGTAILPEVIKLVDKTGGIQAIKDGVVNFVNEVGTSDWLQTLFDRMVYDGPRLCPHSPGYVNGTEPSDFGAIELPNITRDAVSTVVIAVALAAEIGIVVFFERHLQQPQIPTEPLSRQSEIDSQEQKFLNFNNLGDSFLSSYADAALDGLKSYLNETVRDESTGKTDLRVNTLLRDYLLADDGAIPIEFDDVTFTVAGLRVQIDSIFFKGVDTITSLDILEPIGNQTLRNRIRCDYLSIGVNIKLTLLDDSDDEFDLDQLEAETLSISIGFKDVELDLALLVAMSEDILGAFELGSILNTGQIFPCIIKKIHALELTQMAISVGSIPTPIFEGFLPDEVLDQIYESVRPVFDTYQEKLVEGIALVIDDTLRVLLNGAIWDAKTDRDDVSCNTYESTPSDTFVDFRDLFLGAKEAKEAGGSGNSPYGNLLSFAKELLLNEFLGNSSIINKELVRPVTESFSGVEGTIVISDEVASIDVEDVEKFGFDDLGLSVFDVKFDNLDTVGDPFSILEPNNTNSILLNNAAILGVGPDDLIASVSLLLKASGHPALTTWNEMRFSINMNNAAIALTMLAQMQERRLTTFPLEDFLNIDCWMASLAVPELDNDRIRVAGTNSSLALEYFSLAIERFRFNLTCTNCTSQGLASISDVVEVLDETGATAEVKQRSVSFASEILKSDFVQTALDRMVLDSSKKCPHSPDYDENFTVPVSELSFPSLSPEALDSMVFIGALAVDMAKVLIALSHQSIEIDTYPLSGQENLKVPNDTLVDISSLGKYFGDWIDSAIDGLKSYLGELQGDLDGMNGDADIGANLLMRQLVLDENRTLVVKFEDLKFGQNGTEFKVDEMRVIGADTFKSFKFFDDIAPQTIANSFELEQLSIEVDISILTSSSPTAEARTQTESETVTLSFELSNITASATVLLAINEDSFGKLQFGSLLHLETILPCLLSTAHNVELTDLMVKVGSFNGISVAGFLPERLGKILSNTNEMLDTEYGSVIIDAIPKIFGSTVRTILNNWMSYYLDMDALQSCPNPTVQGATPFVDFRDLLLSDENALALGGSGKEPYGDVLRRIVGFINDDLLKINETDGTAAINGLLIDPITTSQSGEVGTFRFDGDLLDSGSRIDIGSFQANLGFKVFNARIAGLDTIGSPLSILNPMENFPHNLNNTASIGIGGKPLRFAATILFFLTGNEDQQLRNEVDISLDLSYVTIMLQMLLKISEASLIEFPLRDFSNLECWLATIPAPQLDRRGVRLPESDPTAALKNLFLSLSEMNLNISCVDCSSPQIEEFAALLSTQEGAEDLYTVGTSLLDYATKLLGGEFLQMQIDRRLNTARRNCPHREGYVENGSAVKYEDFASPRNKDTAIAFLITLLITAACLIAAVLLVIAFVKYIVTIRSKRWVETLSPEKVILLQKLQKGSLQKEMALNRSTKSMFNAREIPLLVRISIPLILLGNIAFFLSGHLSLGGTVNVDVKVGGDVINISNFFEFSIAQSVLDIWRAGGKALAILIIIFSGVWPYTKQLVTLFLWFAPTGMVSISRRGSIFIWLDALAKWSMIDVFVLILSLVAFRVSIQSPDIDFLPNDFYSVDLMVVPMWGLYANMIAQIISQVSSHLIIHYHRRIVHAASAEYEQRISIKYVMPVTDEEGSDSQASRLAKDTNAQEDRLHAHPFARPHRGEKDRVIVRKGADVTLTTVCVALNILLAVGSLVPSYSIEFLGIVGILIESGQGFQQAMAKHSVFGIIGVLFEEAKYLGSLGDYIGLGAFSTVLISSVLFVPMAQAFCLARQWFSPLNQKERWRLSVAIESLQAWQYVEVYIIAILISSWQLGPISDFMVNIYCEGLSGTLAVLAYYGIIDASDAQCFRVQAGAEFGVYILAISAVLLAFLNTFVMKAVSQYERDQSAIVAILQDTPKLADNEFTERDVAAARENITPPAVMFTDTFRWVLLREDSTFPPSANATSIENPNLEVEDGFLDAAHSATQYQNQYRVGQSIDNSSDQGVEKVANATNSINNNNECYDIQQNHVVDTLSIMNPDDEEYILPQSLARSDDRYC